MKSYFNTTGLWGEDLKKAINQAKSLEQSIELLYANSDRSYSPSQVFDLMTKAGRLFPITSVRRAISVLEKAGKLIKTGEMIRGMYSAPEHTWKLKRQVELKQGSIQQF